MNLYETCLQRPHEYEPESWNGKVNLPEDRRWSSRGLYLSEPR